MTEIAVLVVDGSGNQWRTTNRGAACQGFQFGLFLASTESGLAITTTPERWSATWENNRRLAQMADGAGVDFILPVARWTDWGLDGARMPTSHRSVLDPLVSATGLLAPQ